MTDLIRGHRNARFVKCNITSWEDQVSMFEAAITHSPHRSCDIVIANAGISRASGDDLWPLDGMAPERLRYRA